MSTTSTTNQPLTYCLGCGGRPCQGKIHTGARGTVFVACEHCGRYLGRMANPLEKEKP